MGGVLLTLKKGKGVTIEFQQRGPCHQITLEMAPKVVRVLPNPGTAWVQEEKSPNN